jgi:hypothetical protein
MTVNEHLAEFAGLRVAEFESGETPEPGERVAWKLRTDFDGKPFDEIFARFLDTVDTATVTHLVVGYWGASYDETNCDPVALLVDGAARLPNLTALFLGDIISEEAEITWIELPDVGPLLRAYPGLERLGIRGGLQLALSPLSSTALKVLQIQSGSLYAPVLRAVSASDLPNLQTLELWLGTRMYGADVNVADLAPFLSGDRFPALTRLGLMDSEIQDEICAAVATAPVIARLSGLDLSMGVLTDDGAEALLSGQPLTHLVELDLSHHYLTEPMVERVRAALAPVETLLMEPAQTFGAAAQRFVQVAE